MRNDDVLTQEVLGHGAYLCVRAADGDLRGAGEEAIPSLAARLRLRNEFDAADTAPGGTIAFLGRCGATRGDVDDEDVLQAQLVLHVSSGRAEVVDEFCGEASRRLSAAGPVRVLRGSARSRSYTGAEPPPGTRSSPRRHDGGHGTSRCRR